MADVLIALGGNVGDVRATFQKAIANICGMTQAALLARSSDYATPPWGDEQQAPLHQCLHRDRDQPRSACAAVHAAQDRTQIRPRPAKETRWGPRTLDLDLIAYDDVTIEKPELTLPHPRLFERAFVLVPLAEIVPDRVIAGRRVADGAGGAFQRGNRAAARPRLTKRDPKQPFGLAAATWQFPANK